MANLFLQTHSYSLYTFAAASMAGCVVLMHYYSTETLDTQLRQLGTLTPNHYPPLTALKHLITHTIMWNYCITVVAEQLQIQSTKTKTKESSSSTSLPLNFTKLTLKNKQVKQNFQIFSKCNWKNGMDNNSNISWLQLIGII